MWLGCVSLSLCINFILSSNGYVVVWSTALKIQIHFLQCHLLALSLSICTICHVCSLVWTISLIFTHTQHWNKALIPKWQPFVVVWFYKNSIFFANICMFTLVDLGPVRFFHIKGQHCCFWSHQVIHVHWPLTPTPAAKWNGNTSFLQR